MDISFNKVTNKETWLVMEGEEIVGQITCPPESPTWRVKITDGPSKDGFKSSSKAREYVRGFFDGVTHAELVARSRIAARGAPEGES